MFIYITSLSCCFGEQAKNTFVSGETEAFADMQDNELLVVHLLAVDITCFMSWLSAYLILL